MEINGGYDEVVSKLRESTSKDDALSTVIGDLSRILDTVVELDGGTRSAIADRLPAEMNHTYDAEAIVDALRLLERYDLVALEGNTWTPGPAFQQ